MSAMSLLAGAAPSATNRNNNYQQPSAEERYVARALVSDALLKLNYQKDTESALTVYYMDKTLYHGELDPASFFWHHKKNAQAAARQLASYWNTRTHLFEQQRSFLPLNLTKPGVLARGDIQLLLQEEIIQILPAPTVLENGHPVLVYDKAKIVSYNEKMRSQNEAILGNEYLAKLAFCVCSALAQDPQAVANGVAILVRTNKTIVEQGSMAASDIRCLSHVLQTWIPVKTQVVHVLCDCGPDGPTEAANNSEQQQKSRQAQAYRHMPSFLRGMGKFFSARSTVHYVSSSAQACTRLLKVLRYTNVSDIPTSCGGTSKVRLGGVQVTSSMHQLARMKKKKGPSSRRAPVRVPEAPTSDKKDSVSEEKEDDRKPPAVIRPSSPDVAVVKTPSCSTRCRVPMKKRAIDYTKDDAGGLPSFAAHVKKPKVQVSPDVSMKDQENVFAISARAPEEAGNMYHVPLGFTSRNHYSQEFTENLPKSLMAPAPKHAPAYSGGSRQYDSLRLAALQNDVNFGTSMDRGSNINPYLLQQSAARKQALLDQLAAEQATSELLLLQQMRKKEDHQALYRRSTSSMRHPSGFGPTLPAWYQAPGAGRSSLLPFGVHGQGVALNQDDSCSQELKEHAPVLVGGAGPRTIEEALQYIALVDKADYLDACRHVPHLVSRESCPSKFMIAEDFNAMRAARRLALHWKTRKELFGNSAFLPLTQSQGALSAEDLVVLNTGSLVMLPSDEGKPRVLCADRSRMLESSQEANVSRRRAMMYLLTMLSQEEATAPESGFDNTKQSSPEGVVLLTVMSSPRVIDFTKLFDLEILKLVEAVPLKLASTQLAMCLPKSGKDTAVQAAMKEAIQQMHMCFGDKTEVATATCRADLQAEVQGPLGYSNSCVPLSMGGSWKYDNFSTWLKQRRKYEKQKVAMDAMRNWKEGNQSEHGVAANGTMATPKPLSEAEKNGRKKKLNALYSRRKRERTRVEKKALQVEQEEWTAKNEKVRAQNARLEDMLAEAKRKVALLESGC